MRPEELPDDPDIERLLGQLDHPTPDVSAEDVLRRARRTRVRRLARAAGVLLGLAVASGAAYAAPGSPLPGWIIEVGRRLGVDVGDSGPRRPSIPQGARDSAGVDVLPEGDLTIRFVGEGLDGTLEVTMTDDDRVSVRTSPGAASFTSEPDRLLVEHASPDTVRVTIPRAAPRVEIQVGTRRVFIQEPTGVTVAPGVEVGADGTYVMGLRADGG